MLQITSPMAASVNNRRRQIIIIFSPINSVRVTGCLSERQETRDVH